MAAVPRERTALSWQRTGWTMLGAGAVVLHALPGVPGVVDGVVLLLAGVLCSAVVAPLRMRALAASDAADRPVAVPAVVVALTVLVVLVGTLAVVAIAVWPAGR